MLSVYGTEGQRFESSRARYVSREKLPANRHFLGGADVLGGWQHREQQGNSAKAMVKSSHPGVYRRGSRWVAVYRIDGRQRKESAAMFREAREIKLRRAAEAACDAAGPTLHSYALEWSITTPGVAPTT